MSADLIMFFYYVNFLLKITLFVAIVCMIKYLRNG